MTHLGALLQAREIFERRENMDREQLINAARALGEWGLFSGIAIAKITGLDQRIVSAAAPKSDRTGGRFNPATLGDLIDLIRQRNRGEMDVFTARRALDGTSVYFAARVTGIPKTTLRRWAQRADSMTGEAA